MFTVGDSQLKLQFRGRFEDPSVITRSIGCEPTDCGGEFWRSALFDDPCVEYLHEGRWYLELPRERGGDVERHIAALFDGLNPDVQCWREITSKYEGQIDNTVGLFTYNGGFDLSSDIVRRIAERGLKITFDVWAAGGYPEHHVSPGQNASPTDV